MIDRPRFSSGMRTKPGVQPHEARPTEKDQISEIIARLDRIEKAIAKLNKSSVSHTENLENDDGDSEELGPSGGT